MLLESPERASSPSSQAPPAEERPRDARGVTGTDHEITSLRTTSTIHSAFRRSALPSDFTQGRSFQDKLSIAIFPDYSWDYPLKSRAPPGTVRRHRSARTPCSGPSRAQAHLQVGRRNTVQYARLDCCSIAYSTTSSFAIVRTTTTTGLGFTTRTTKATQPTPNNHPFRQFDRFGISTRSYSRARPLFRQSIPLSFLQSHCDHST